MGTRTRGYHPAIYAMRESMLLRQELREQEWAHVQKQTLNKTLRKSYWFDRQCTAMAALKAIDPTGWETWYDSDAVPVWGTEKSRALLVEARVRELAARLGRPYIRAVARLYRGQFIWQDPAGCFIYGKERKIFEFKDQNEAKAHIDAEHALNQYRNGDR